MKTPFKKLLVLFTIIITTSAIVNISFPTPTHASDFSCDRSILGLTTWDCGLAEFDNEDHLKSNVIIIASNVFVDITVIAAYLVLGYVIYGGYLYIFSAGDPNKVTTGKKTLIHAFTGLAIVLLSNIILNAIRYALISNNKFSDQGCIPGTSCDAARPGEIISHLINWIIGISGITAAVFAVMGGIGYVTSSGDPQKLKKAKDTIIYALIGLAIVGLAQIITAFISNMIKDAETASYPNETLIAKEYHEKQAY